MSEATSLDFSEQRRMKLDTVDLFDDDARARATGPRVVVSLILAVLAGCGGGAPEPGAPPAAAPAPGLDPAGQRAARQALAGRAGAVVALDVESGRRIVAAGDVDTLVPPGSTLKVLFAGAGLADGLITENSRLEGDEGPLPDIVNAGGERFGPINVEEALVRSSNTAFVDLTLRLGAERVERWLRRVGWGEPRVRSMRTADGGYRDPDLHNRATAAQLAMLARHVARPRIWSPRVAAILRAAMRRAVTEGTGTTMRDPVLAVAAKTGTMPRGDGRTQASVIALAPAGDPTVAIAVSVTADPGETGGSAAGPATLAVLRSLLVR